MTMVLILAFLSLIWWIAVGVWRNIGFGDGCAVTTLWGTVPVWSLWLSGVGLILGLVLAVIETAAGKSWTSTWGASLATASLIGLVAAIAGYNLPRLMISYKACP